jgi:putative tricarboxylic transport membrane protein
MAWGDRGTSLIWMVLGICQGVASWQIGLGSFMEPGNGFMPFIMALLMIIFAVLLFIESNGEIRKKRDRKVLIWEQADWRRIIQVILILVCYALLLPKLGFLVDTFLMMVVLLKSGEAIKWHWVILVGLIASSITWTIFGIWLRISFPRGVFGF